MRAIRISFVAATLLALAHGQNAQLPIPCCDVDVNSIPSSDRQLWCRANLQTCTSACIASGQPDQRNNQCDQSSLSYNCRCNDGGQPDLSLFMQTVPGLRCQFWYSDCVSSSKNDAERSACAAARERTCGNRTDPENALQSSTPTGSGLASLSSALRSSTPSSSSRSASIASSSTPSSSPSSTGGAADSGDSGVPIGTIVGAVVGAVGGITVILIVGWCMWRRRQKKSKDTVEKVGSTTGYEKAELHGTPTTVHHAELQAGSDRDAYPYLARNVELDGDAKAEVHGDERSNRAAELHDEAKPGQLSASDSVRVAGRERDGSTAL